MNQTAKSNPKRTITTAAVAGALAVERFAHAAGSDLLKVSLVGCGGRGSGAVVQTLKGDSNTKLVAMADAFQEKLGEGFKNISKQQAVADRIDVPESRQFTGLDAYKKAIDLADVVVLATPCGFRPIHFEYAIQNNKHVFMEKPVGVDAPGIRRVLEIAELAKKKNLKVGVGLQRRHDPSYVEAIKRIQDGAIGDIVYMRALWTTGDHWFRTREQLETLKGRKVTEMEFQVWNWYFFSWLNGDPILEQPIHNLDVCCWAKNDYPIRANGMGGRQVRTGKEYGNVFDHNAIEYEFKDGARMFVEGRQIGGCWNFIGETLHGTKGNAELGTGRKTIRGVTEWVYVPSGKPVDPYQQEHDDFYAAIRNDKPYSEVEYAAKTTLTGIIGRMCTYGGKQVTWEEAFNSKLELGPKVFSWDAEPPIKPGPDGFYPISIPGKSAVL